MKHLWRRCDIMELHLLVNSMCSHAKRYEEKLASILKGPF